MGFIDIAVLAYPGAQLSALHGLTDLFLTANRLAERRTPGNRDCFRVSHWQASTQDGRVRCSYSSDPHKPENVACFIVPPSLGGQGADGPGEVYVDWVKAQHESGAIAGSVCVGAFLLARAGLLDGRPATTHWALKDQFAGRFPDVVLETEKLVVEDGDIITAGGIMAWVDLGLRLVDRFMTPTVMLDVARYFLVDPSGRAQSFYSTFAPRLNHGDDAVLKVQRWLQTGFGRAVSIASMSETAGLGERTFLRRFHKATGHKPTHYVQTLRVSKAREMLELSGMPVNAIAWSVGYEDPAAFRKVFHKVMGLTPGDYRRRFALRAA